MTVLDAEMFLKENFDLIKSNSIEGCPSMLAWLPEKSHIWKTYGTRMDCPWKLLIGRRTTWSQLEVVLRHSDNVNSAMFSPASAKCNFSFLQFLSFSFLFITLIDFFFEFSFGATAQSTYNN